MAIVEISHTVTEYNIAQREDRHRIENRLPTRCKPSDRWRQEDVVPSLTDTRITVDDNEKVEMRDESLSLEEVFNKQVTGPAWTTCLKTISSFLFLLISPMAHPTQLLTCRMVIDEGS